MARRRTWTGRDDLLFGATPRQAAGDEVIDTGVDYINVDIVRLAPFIPRLPAG